MRSFGHIVVGLLALVSLVFGDPRPWMRDLKPQAKEPWMGAHFGWVDQVTASHLKEVPQGFGLVVTSVEPTGPAQEAGLKAMDVLWKVDDQLLANRGQLVCLLRMKGVGASMVLHVARGGEMVEMTIHLAERPHQSEQAEVARRVISPPIPGLTLPNSVRWVNYDQRTAFLEDGERTYSVSRDKEGFRYVITADEKDIGQGALKGDAPGEWPSELDLASKEKLKILVRSLVNAESRETQTKRMPRVRRVPTSQNLTQETAKN